MILTWKEIIKQYKKWIIKIDKFNIDNITTNSYDLHLWDKIIKYKNDILDPSKENDYDIIDIPKDWYILKQWEFVLASNKEKIWSDYFVPIIHNKSGIARLGLFIHITADLIDIWSYWNTTFQLFATLPVKIYPNMKIAQVSFWQPKWDIELYKWKYQGSEWPQASKIHLDL